MIIRQGCHRLYNFVWTETGHDPKHNRKEMGGHEKRCYAFAVQLQPCNNILWQDKKENTLFTHKISIKYSSYGLVLFNYLLGCLFARLNAFLKKLLDFPHSYLSKVDIYRMHFIA